MTELLTIEQVVATEDPDNTPSLGEEMAEAFRAKSALVDRFKAIAGFCPLGVFIDGRDGRCIYANAAFQRILGVGEEEILGDNWKELLAKADADRVTKLWDEFCSSGRREFKEIERFSNRSTGKIAVCEVIAERLDSGDYAGYVIPLCRCGEEDLTSL